MMNENMVSVSQFSNYVKQIFNAEELLHNILIFGEVSDFNISRGHAYFNLKDEQALLQCVRFNALELDYLPKKGDMVVVQGSPNYYTKGGRFSFVVQTIKAYGIGLLYQKFLEMKEKLEKEGLFDEKHKKPLPKNIKRVGVVTSETGAVIQDIINITTRRNPMLDIVLFPVKVQGVGAEESIANGLKEMDKTNVDLIILARGGGSLEDLAPFNTELVARAIFDTQKMTISAVGHETDVTIADFVADLRAPTPSAAAELVAVDLSAEKRNFQANVKSLFETYQSFLENNFDKTLRKSKDLLLMFEGVAMQRFSLLKENLLKLNHGILNVQTKKQQNLLLLMSKIEQNNPLAILKKGFASVEMGGKRITSVHQANPNDQIDICLKDGKLKAEIKQKEEQK